MKIKYVKLPSLNGEGTITVPVSGNQVIINKSGFIPIKGNWLEEMNPARIKGWYRIPKGLNVC